MRAGRIPWRTAAIATLLLAAAFASFSPAVRGLDCPQPQVITNGQVLWEGQILTVSMDSGDSYVTGFLVAAEVVGGIAFFDEFYDTVPAAAGIDLDGLGGTNVRVTVTSRCSGEPWTSDPVVRNVAVRSEGPPPPPPPPDTPTDNGFWMVFLLAGVAAAVILPLARLASLRGQRLRVTRPCPRCGTRYTWGVFFCLRDGAPLVPPPPPTR